MINKYKLRKGFLFIFIMLLSVGKTANVLYAEEAISTENVKTQHYIGWIFATYSEPDFYSKKTGFYSPQTIEFSETNGDGWGRVEINDIPHWVYFEKNLRLIDRYTPVYNNKGDAEPADIIQPQIIEIIEQDGNWVQIITWLGPKWLEFNSKSPHVLLDVPSYNQITLGYPTGCEIISLCMMINYVTYANPDTLVAQIPRAYDPNLGFRGNPASEEGFTVFPSALLEVTNEYLSSAYDMTGCEIEDLKDKLCSGAPVVVWYSGFGFNVHAICLTGYDEKGFYYNDPWTGKKDKFISYSSFFNIWNTPIYDGNKNIEYPARKALSCDPPKVSK